MRALIRNVEKDHSSFHLFINQCRLLHNLHSLQKLDIVKTGRQLGDRFQVHLRDVEKDNKDASKPVARDFNLPDHFK